MVAVPPWPVCWIVAVLLLPVASTSASLSSCPKAVPAVKTSARAKMLVILRSCLMGVGVIAFERTKSRDRGTGHGDVPGAEPCSAHEIMTRGVFIRVRTLHGRSEAGIRSFAVSGGLRASFFGRSRPAGAARGCSSRRFCFETPHRMIALPNQWKRSQPHIILSPGRGCIWGLRRPVFRKSHPVTTKNTQTGCTLSIG